MAFQYSSPFTPIRTPRSCSNTPTPCRESCPSNLPHRGPEALHSRPRLSSWSLWGTRRWRDALGARASGGAATVTHAPQGSFTATEAPVLGPVRVIANATATEPLLSPSSLARRAAVGTGHSYGAPGGGTAGGAAAAVEGALRRSPQLPEAASQSSIPVNASVNGKLIGSATTSRPLAVPMPPGAHAPAGTGRLHAAAAAGRGEGTGGFATPHRRTSAPSSSSSSRRKSSINSHEEAPPVSNQDSHSTSSQRGHHSDSKNNSKGNNNSPSRGKGVTSKGEGGTRSGGGSRMSTRINSRSRGGAARAGASKWSSYFDMAQVQDLQQLQELVDGRVGAWHAARDPGPIQAAFNIAAKVPDTARAAAAPAGRSTSSTTSTTSTSAGNTATTGTTTTAATPSDASATPGTARWSVMHTLASIYLPLCSSLTLTRTADATIPLWACAKTGYGWRSAADEQPLAAALLKQLRANGFELVRHAKANEVGNLVWALSKAPEHLAAGQGDLLDACAERLEGLAFEDINTQACSNVMLSFARLGVTRGSLLHHLTACLAQKAASAPSQELANSLYALGELAAGGGGAGPHMPRAEDLRALRDEVVRRLEAGAGQQQQQQQQGDGRGWFKSQEVSNMLLGCAKLAVDDPQLVVALAEAAGRAARRMQMQELANSVWALGKLNQLPACASAAAPAVTTAVEHVAREVTDRLKLNAAAFNAQNLTNLLYGFAVLQQPASSTGTVPAAGAGMAGGEGPAAATPRVGEAARALAAECLRRRFRSFNPQDVSNAAWAVAKLQHTDQQWYAAAVAAAQWPTFARAATSQSWSSLWYALALAQHRPPEGLLRRTVAAVGAVAGEAWAQNCANQLWALALLGMYDRELVGAMLRRLVQLMAGGGLEMRDLTNSVWAVAVMGPEALRANCGAVGQLLQEVVVSWERGNGRQELPAQELTQLWKVHLELQALAKAEAAGSKGSSGSRGGKDGSWGSGSRGGDGGGDVEEVSRVAGILQAGGRPGPDGCGPALLVAMAQAAEKMQMESNTGSRMQLQVYESLLRVQRRQRRQQQGEEGETEEEDEEVGGNQSGGEEQQLGRSTAASCDGVKGPAAGVTGHAAEGTGREAQAQGRGQGQPRGHQHVESGACGRPSDWRQPAIVSITPEAPVFQLRSRVDMVVECEGGRKVAVEVDGPLHFFANRPYTTLRDGTTALRDRQLERVYGQGNLVRVPYWEWSVVQGDRAQREAYLLGLLCGAGCGVEVEREGMGSGGGGRLEVGDVQGGGKQRPQRHGEGRGQEQEQEQGQQEEQGKEAAQNAQQEQQPGQQEREREQDPGDKEVGAESEGVGTVQAPASLTEDVGQTQGGEHQGRRKRQRWWKRKRGQQAVPWQPRAARGEDERGDS